MDKKKLVLILLTYIILSNFQYWLVNSGGNMSNNQFDTNSDISVKASAAQYECVDAWIIIGGDKASHAEWDLVLLTLEWVYDQALACGNTDDEILMLVPLYSVAHTSREFGASSRDNLDYAFNTWAPSKVGPNGILAVYLHDHGGTNAMSFSPWSSLAAWELDQYLDGFETASGCDRIMVVYEACSSGSFLDELSKSDRIIMTSTEPYYSAYWSPIPPHISMFGEGLFKSILAGNSIGDAFVDANNEIKALGYGELQRPCIDDNHDGMGHIVNAWGQLPSTGDGNDAKNTFLCQGCPPILIQAPQVMFVPLKFWVAHNPAIINIPLSIGVDNSTDIAKVICRVISEDWTPPEPSDNETMGLWDENENAFQWDLTPDGSGNFTGRVAITSPILDSDYTLSFFAEDVDGRRGQIISTQVGINEDGIAPIDNIDPTVIITNPSTNTNVSDVITVTAEGDDDQALDKIQIFIDGLLLKEESMPLYYPYPEASYTFNTTKYANGNHTITAKAIDKANNAKSDSITLNFQNELVSMIPGFHITTLFIGSLLGLIIIYFIYIKRNQNRKHK
jgi:hypothetical protein